ncbi:MAG: hypothetical protein ACRD6N_00515 [Pyrinomonadaceae bacterium]
MPEKTKIQPRPIRPRPVVPSFVYVRDRIDVNQDFLDEMQAELEHRKADGSLKVGTPLYFLAREIIHAPNFTFALHGFPLIFAADLYDGKGGGITTTGPNGDGGAKGGTGTPGKAEWDATKSKPGGPGTDRVYAMPKRVKKSLLLPEVYEKPAYSGLLKEVGNEFRLHWVNGLRAIRRRYYGILNNKEFLEDDALTACAKEYKRIDFGRENLAQAGRDSDITNLFWWAGSVVRLQNQAASGEVERLQADSKFFRSITVILAIVFGYLLYATLLFPLACSLLRKCNYRFSLKASGVLFFCFTLLLLSFLRFMKLRWDSTERTYEYYIAISKAQK